jgi:hypothetical protein
MVRSCCSAKRFLVVFALSFSALVVTSAAHAASVQASTSSTFSLSSADRGKVIYVADSQLERASFTQDKGGITGKGYLLPPPLVPTIFRRKAHNETEEVERLVNFMSDTLVKKLAKAGIYAVRLRATDMRPQSGLILSGVFTQLSEGNHVRRATFGFGSGATKAEVYVNITEASQPLHLLYSATNQQKSGRYPGALVTLNPFAGAARFAMTRNAPEKTVKKTASLIAKQIVKQLNSAPAAAE